jgi:hypothetical protein
VEIEPHPSLTLALVRSEGQFHTPTVFLFTEISTPNINYPGLIWDSSGGTVSREHGLIFTMLAASLVSLMYSGSCLVL